MRAGVRPECAHAGRSAPGERQKYATSTPEHTRSAPVRAGVRPESDQNVAKFHRGAQGVLPCEPECARSASSMSQFVKVPGAENA